MINKWIDKNCDSIASVIVIGFTLLVILWFFLELYSGHITLFGKDGIGDLATWLSAVGTIAAAYFALQAAKKAQSIASSQQNSEIKKNTFEYCMNLVSKEINIHSVESMKRLAYIEVLLVYPLGELLILNRKMQTARYSNELENLNALWRQIDEYHNKISIEIYAYSGILFSNNGINKNPQLNELFRYLQCLYVNYKENIEYQMVHEGLTINSTATTECAFEELFGSIKIEVIDKIKDKHLDLFVATELIVRLIENNILDKDLTFSILAKKITYEKEIWGNIKNSPFISSQVKEELQNKFPCLDDFYEKISLLNPH